MAQGKGAQGTPLSVTPGTFVTEAVVLRLADHGEADRVVTLLTESHGKVTAVAPGARRSRRRFGAALSPFGTGQAALRERRGQELLLLESLHADRGFPHLSQELGRFGHAAYACELCLHLCPPGEPEPDVLALLRGFLGYLDGLPIIDRPRVEALRAFGVLYLASGKATEDGVAKAADIFYKAAELARTHGVPVLSRPPLARALWKHVHEGRAIPTNLYRAVAEVLAYVYRLRQRGNG